MINFFSNLDLEITLRLLLAVFLAGVVGYEREKHGKGSAGLRTHILVCLGSTLITLTSIYAFGDDKVDPSRVAAGIVTGIGFLGAGTIMKATNESKQVVIGLTTAASLWVIAAIGMALGAGFYFAALITTVLSYFTLEVLRKVKEYEHK